MPTVRFPTTGFTTVAAAGVNLPAANGVQLPADTNYAEITILASPYPAVADGVIMTLDFQHRAAPSDPWVSRFSRRVTVCLNPNDGTAPHMRVSMDGFGKFVRVVASIPAPGYAVAFQVDYGP